MTSPTLEWMHAALSNLETHHRLRELRTIEASTARTVTLAGRELIVFCSNDYLGMGRSKQMAAALATAANAHGSGAGASRLITGNAPSHDRLEERLAHFHDAESALVFGTGYQTNVGVLSALAGVGDVIVSDELNHASIIDGCRLSRARVVVYPHNDVDGARALLDMNRDARRRILVSESVFSMDGDVAPLVELAQIAAETDAMLMVDEAHAVGVLGNGRGACAAAGIVPDVTVATLGKAFGCFGAYVCGAHVLREYLVNHARSFVFTTAIPPALADAAAAAVDRVGEDASLVETLERNIHHFANGLRGLGVLRAGAGQTAIFPLIVGDDAATMTLTRRFADAGLFVQGIRPPTVPTGTARLRFTLSAAHRVGDLDLALQCIGDAVRAGEIPPQ